MSTEEKNREAADAPEAPATEEPKAPVADETVSLSKADYDKLISEHGSFKRELKDLKKPKEPQEPSTPDKNADLIQKTFLLAAGIKEDDEVELALDTAKKWGMELDKLVKDEDFIAKLEKARTKKANELATAAIKGDGTGKSASQTPEFYISRGTPPTRQEVPDRKTRAAIIRQMTENAKTSGKKFYND